MRLPCFLLCAILAPSVLADKDGGAHKLQAVTTLVGFEPRNFSFEEAALFDAAFMQAYRLAHIDDADSKRIRINYVTIEEETSHHTTRPDNSNNVNNNNGKKNLRHLKNDDKPVVLTVMDVHLRIDYDCEDGSDECWPTSNRRKRRLRQRGGAYHRKLPRVKRSERKFEKLLCGTLQGSPEPNFNSVEDCYVSYPRG